VSSGSPIASFTICVPVTSTHPHVDFDCFARVCALRADAPLRCRVGVCPRRPAELAIRGPLRDEDPAAVEQLANYVVDRAMTGVIADDTSTPRTAPEWQRGHPDNRTARMSSGGASTVAASPAKRRFRCRLRILEWDVAGNGVPYGCVSPNWPGDVKADSGKIWPPEQCSGGRNDGTGGLRVALRGVLGRVRDAVTHVSRGCAGAGWSAAWSDTCSTR